MRFSFGYVRNAPAQPTVARPPADGRRLVQRTGGYYFPAAVADGVADVRFGRVFVDSFRVAGRAVRDERTGGLPRVPR